MEEQQPYRRGMTLSEIADAEGDPLSHQDLTPDQQIRMKAVQLAVDYIAILNRDVTRSWLTMAVEFEDYLKNGRK